MKPRLSRRATLALYGSGLPVASVLEASGRARSTLREWLKATGVARRPHGRPPGFSPSAETRERISASLRGRG